MPPPADTATAATAATIGTIHFEIARRGPAAKRGGLCGRLPLPDRYLHASSGEMRAVVVQEPTPGGGGQVPAHYVKGRH